MNEDTAHIYTYDYIEKIQYQKFIHNNLLPYVDGLEAESENLLAEIKANLGRAIIYNEVWPGCYVWVSKLYHYIKVYGLRFKKEDHILFVKLLFELVTVPQIPTVSTFKCISVLLLLLKKKKLLSPDELELPWRPLYKALRFLIEPDENYLDMYSISPIYETAIESLILCSKAYFPLSATQEILDELRPTLCPLDVTTMSQSMLTLRLFLPIQLPPQHHALGHQLWFEELMRLWEISHNAPEWEHEMMDLIAPLANCNIGYIDWEPYIPLMFTRFMRCLKLPVSYSKTERFKLHEIDPASIAIWIVSTLGHGSSVQTYFEKFLKSIETYFHPANSGSWLAILKKLLMKLSFYFITRLHRERYAKITWETPVPEEYKLTDSDIDAFVNSMIPVTMTAIFNKLNVNDAALTLHYLATMRPNLVIPHVMDKVSSTLDSLSTESYKLIATLSCMEAIARPMAEGSGNINTGYTYPEGPTHIVPLLTQLLPIIDPNNPEKCFLALRLVSIYACFAPIMDSSNLLAAVDTEERMNFETTSGFDDFVLQLLDKIFSFIDYSSLQLVRLENSTGGEKNKLEKVTETSLYSVWMVLLKQTNNTLFENILNKLRSFITERILEIKVAGQLASSLCRVFARVNGKETLRALLPELSQIILDIIGESNDIVKEENLDGRLLHAMLLLSAVVDTTGDNLLPHIETLTNVLDRVLILRSREGNNLACILLKTVLHSLSTMIPYNFESTEKLRYWAQVVDIKSLSIKWYIPGKEEMAVLNQLFLKYLLPEVNKLERFCNDWTVLNRDELRVSLNIVNSIIHSCDSLLPLWKEEPLNLVKSSLKWVPFVPTLGAREEISMPDGSNVKRYIVRLLSKVQSVILNNAEEDTKSLIALIKIWGNILIGKAAHSNAAAANYKLVENARRMMMDMLVRKKGIMGSFILLRSEIQHLTRSYSQILNFTETHKEIVLNLFTLATSRYAGVRWQAQYIVSRSAFYYYPFSWKVVVPKLLGILEGDPEVNHDEYKGALHVLLSSQDNPIVMKHDWKTLRELWSAFVLSKPSEKLSIIRLKDNLLDLIRKQFETVAITYEVPDTCLEIVTNFWKTDPQPTLSQPTKDEIEESLKLMRAFNECNMTSYNGLIDDLLNALLEKNLHWRHRLIAIDLIRYLVNPEQMYPPKVVRYFLGALIHESLHERNLATRVVTCMLYQQKRKHPKITIDPPVLAEQDEQRKSQSINFALGPRPDNNWLQYNCKTRPLTAEQWDEPRFVHLPYIGYYTWPKKIEIYAPSSEQPCLDPNVRELTEHEKEVDIFFNDPQNIQKLVKFYSLEPRKDRVKFNVLKYLLFRSLFRNHGIVFLKHFLPHLRELVVDKQSSQICAAEIITGIIKGSKHWPYSMVCEMWDSLLPIIRLAILNLSPETLVEWTTGLSLAVQNRDPNRYHWLLEWLMEEIRFGELESSLIECGRLFILQEILYKQPWRVMELLQRLLNRIEGRLLANPFENVRERLGSILLLVFVTSSKSAHSSNSELIPKLDDFINKILPELQPFMNENAKKFNKEVENLSAGTTAVETSNSKISGINEEEREKAIRLLKTVCKWILNTKHLWCGIPPELYKLFPAIYQLENCETDKELKKLCTSTLAVYAHAITLPCNMPIALEAVEEMSKHASWWTRSACLELLQAWVFYNMGTFLSNPAWVNCIKCIVLRLLEDERVEVRKNAGKVLSGLLHCAFIPEQESLLVEFKKKSKTKLYKRDRLNCSKDDNRKKNLNCDALRIRHAAIIGMCAYVQAHPYDIPKYLPPIFEDLSPHMNDPEPIPTIIKKTLDDFKRTHNGLRGVAEYSQQFTEEQLSALQDLIMPPSYYA